MLRFLFIVVVVIAAQSAPARAQSGASETEAFKPAPPASTTGPASADGKKNTPSPPAAATGASSKAPAPSAGTLPTPSQAYPPPPAPPVAPAATAPAPRASWPPPAANGPAPVGVPPPAGYPPAPPYPPPGYAYPGPPYGYPPPGYGYGYVPPANRPGAHLHDGFYLNLAMGLGGFGFTIDSDGTKTEISGAGIPVELALGGALTPHLILFGAFYEVVSQDNPTLKVRGQSTTSSGTVSLAEIGPGVAYYFESNYFLSGVLAFSKLDFSSFNSLPRTSKETNWGLTFTLTAGREWWVSDNWALGLAAQLMAGSMKDDQFINNGDVAASASPSWSVGVFSLLFSASYN